MLHFEQTARHGETRAALTDDHLLSLEDRLEFLHLVEVSDGAAADAGNGISTIPPGPHLHLR